MILANTTTIGVYCKLYQGKNEAKRKIHQENSVRKSNMEYS